MQSSLVVTPPEGLDDSPNALNGLSGGQDGSLPQRVEALLRAANAHYQRQDFRAARAALQALDPLEAHTAETLQTIGNLSMLLGEPGPAGEAFRRALALQPGNVDLLVALAIVDGRLQKNPDHNGFLQRALALAPEHPNALKLLADWHLTQARYVEAALVYGKLLAKDPTRVDICLALAKCFFETGEHATAATTLQHVLQLEPDNALARENLAVLQGPGSPSKETAAPVAKLPPAAEEYLRQADAAFTRGDLPGACELLSRVLALAPGYVPAQVCLGNLQFQLGQFAPALQAYLAAQALEPESVDILVRVAATALRCGEVSRFEQALRHALAVDAHHVGALRLLADTNLQTGRFADAAQGYRQIARQTPQDTEVLMALGRCEFELGAWEAARRVFQQVLELEPSLELARENLAAVESTLARASATPSCSRSNLACSQLGKAQRMSRAESTEDILAGLKGRVAIVGNATPNHQFGELIDAHDVVIRLNNFRLAGFEKLVGTKTDYRCTSAWKDIEHRNEHPEFSPFTAASRESANLAHFNQSNHWPVLAARTDIHPLLPETPNPSTGLALIRLCTHLGLQVDLFAFDGFQTAHYWEQDRNFYTTHSRSEMDIILKLPGVVLYAEPAQPASLRHPPELPEAESPKVESDQEFYSKLFIESPRWSGAEPNDDESSRWQQIERFIEQIPAFNQSPASRRPRILDLGCGRGWLTKRLTAYGEAEGVEPVAAVVEHGRRLFPGLPLSVGHSATVLQRPDFAPYDLVVSSEVIEHVRDDQKGTFVSHLSRLLKPGGHVIITTPRRECWRDYACVWRDPSQPVEDWLSEAQVRELFLGQFVQLGLERVLIERTTHRFIRDLETENSSDLQALYQVWAFQKPLDSTLAFAGTAAASAEAVGRLVQQASQQGEQGDFEAQKTALEQLLSLLPDSPEVRMAHACAQYALGQVEAARCALVMTTALYPDFLPGHEKLAEVLQKTGAGADAETALGRAITLFPAEPALYQQLLKLLLRQKRFGEAAEIMNELPLPLRTVLNRHLA